MLHVCKFLYICKTYMHVNIMTFTIPFGGDDFLIAFHQYFSSEKTQLLSKKLNTAIYTPPDECTSRNLNHWEKQGILTDCRPSGKGWRKYSAIEIVWVKIVLELREFNFPLEKLITLRNSLTYPGDKKFAVSQMPILEVYVAQSLIKFRPIYLLVSPEGQGIIGFKNQIEDSKEFNFIGTHVNINLATIIKSVFPKADLKFSFKMDWELSEEEEELVSMLRQGTFDKIEVKTKEGKIKTISASELINDKKLFREIANDAPFQSIETRIRDGKKVSIRRTINKRY